MKILFLSHLYPWPKNNINTLVVHCQGKELVRYGHQVKVICPIPYVPFLLKYFKKKWNWYYQIPQKTIINGIEIYYPRYINFPKALFFASSGGRMHKGIKKTVNEIYKNFKFDLIHSHMVFPDGYAGMLLSEKYKKPLVTTIQATDLDITAKRNCMCFNIIKEVLKHSRKILVPTSRLAKQTKRLYGTTQDIISYGIYQEDVFKDSINLSQKYKNYIILLSVSKLIESKGIDLNIKAIAKLKEKYKNLIYLIVGAGPERKNLKKLAEDLNIKNNVEFLGEMPHNKVMEYMSICDVFSLPSWQETFGLVYLEAMIHGKAVIGCQGQGVDNIIKEKEVGLLIKTKNVNSLISVIDYLFLNLKETKEMGNRAKKLVLENYTWEKVVKQLIDLYRSLIA